MKGDFKNTAWTELSFAVIGIGLIGGSYIKALRRLGAREIIGIDINEEVLRQAQADGMLDLAATRPGAVLGRADVIICALYPEQIVDFVRANVQHFKSNVLLTDVAGIKGDMPRQVQSLLGGEMEFISGHPMAGRQSSGYAMSDAAIFDNANYIIIKDSFNSAAAAAWLHDFAMALGCRSTVEVTPKEHDKIIAYTSNLPHITAVSLMNSSSFGEKTKFFVAGSFRDGSRVADINPDLWSSLFLGNSEAVINEIDSYVEQLLQWRQALLAKDEAALKKMMRLAGERRKELY